MPLLLSCVVIMESVSSYYPVGSAVLESTGAALAAHVCRSLSRQSQLPRVRGNADGAAPKSH